MLIVHRPQLGDPIPAYNGPTCVYTTTKALGNRGKHRDIELHSLSLCYDSRMKPFFQAPAPIYPSYNSGLEVDSLSSVASGSDGRDHYLQKVNLEICLSPEVEGDSGQLELARDIKEALEKYEKASQEADGNRGHMGKLKIIVGDDIPPCPCCGRLR